MLLSVPVGYYSIQTTRCSQFSAFLGTLSSLPKKRQTRWELLPDMALQVSCRYSNWVRPPAVCNPPIYLAIGALQTQRYPEMSGLHSKHLPTENVVKIKYASSIYLFQRKTVCQYLFIYFKFIVAKLTAAGCSPKVLDQWVRHFPIFPNAYLNSLLQTNFASSKLTEICLYWMNRIF